MILTTLDKLTFVAFLAVFLVGLATSNDVAVAIGTLGLVLMSLFVRVMEELSKLNGSKGE